jgi:isocitrate dehydrogenase (NAD+)
MQLARRLLTTTTTEQYASDLNRYGSRFVVTMIPGDGIGQELCQSVKLIFAQALVPVDWDDVGPIAGAGDFDRALESIRRNRICLKGSSPSPSPSIISCAIGR